MKKRIYGNDMHHCDVCFGTRARYEKGDLSGTWFAIDEYEDGEELMEAARDHYLAEEEDPSLMIFDYEGPQGLVSVDTNEIYPEAFDFIQLTPFRQKLICAYSRGIGIKGVEAFRYSMRWALELFLGTAESDEEFAMDYITDTTILDSRLAIDWNRTWHKSLSSRVDSFTMGATNYYFEKK